MMTSPEADPVVRLEAHLLHVERRSQMAVVSFSVRVGADVDRLAGEIGSACLVGVLLAADVPAGST